MKRLALLLFLLLLSIINCQLSIVMAQTERYWALGTAVPGGKQELTPFPNKQFKYTGRLVEGGTLRFCNMEEPKGISVRFLKPTYEDVYAVTNATPFTLVRDSTASLWKLLCGLWSAFMKWKAPTAMSQFPSASPRISPSSKTVVCC